MKKVILSIVALVILSGCGNMNHVNDKNQENDESNSNQSVDLMSKKDNEAEQDSSNENDENELTYEQIEERLDEFTDKTINSQELHGFAIMEINQVKDTLLEVIVNDGIDTLHYDGKKSYVEQSVRKFKEVEQDLFGTDELEFEFKFQDGSDFLKEDPSMRPNDKPIVLEKLTNEKIADRIDEWEEKTTEVGDLVQYGVMKAPQLDGIIFEASVTNNLDSFDSAQRKQLKEMATVELKKIEREVFGSDTLEFEFRFVDGSDF